MNFRFKERQDSPADICEGEIRICSSQFKELTGQPASAHRLKRWKGRVVAVTSPAGTVYRVVKGHGHRSIPAGICWMGPRTRLQLDIHHHSELEIDPMSIQWWARFLFYNHHLEDAVRFSFRIGFWGLILAVISLGLSLATLVR
jgi:hypothetical protein